MVSTEWIPVDNQPEFEDCYIIAWLPRKTKRKECFYAIASFESGEWNLEGMEDRIEFWKDIEIHAWRELPEPYILED